MLEALTAILTLTLLVTGTIAVSYAIGWLVAHLLQ